MINHYPFFLVHRSCKVVPQTEIKQYRNSNNTKLIKSLHSHKRQNFQKKLLNTKCVFWFSLKHLSAIFLILRRNERDKIENVYWSSCQVPVIVVRLNIKLAFSRQIWGKYSNMKLCENPFIGSRVVPCRQTDRQTAWKSVYREPSCSM